MADKRKDAEDRMLETMFQSEPIPDNGFSNRVLSKIRLRLWVRRLALPVAALVGGGIAARPLADAAVATSRILTVLPRDLFSIPMGWIPQFQVVVLGAMLLIAAALAIRMIED